MVCLLKQGLWLDGVNGSNERIWKHKVVKGRFKNFHLRVGEGGGFGWGGVDG